MKAGMENSADPTRQSKIPTSFMPTSSISWNILTEIAKIKRSLILETVAFSKGEIHIVIKLAVSSLREPSAIITISEGKKRVGGSWR